ncbi:MAG TPA: hypothetical protein H9821_04855 [Candidatus Rothia avicola]|uniref:Uncharacterized protein n=1 Tax=Candidatus Rothia avicola TaxID=2840478 RepID=A0A9D2CPF5_9MICC|nr:hypothetical protein [Candidatus Rothia avicola]
MSENPTNEQKYATDNYALLLQSQAIERIACLANELRTAINSKDYDWKRKMEIVSSLVTQINVEHIQMMQYEARFVETSKPHSG